ncbi:22219_t:CDS:2 [Entrophospora sp. SA101]|nr:22219_t:CDS:2 [Entrophospora sp. SA101]
MWRARDYYNLIDEHDEFIKRKVCSNNQKEKMFKHNNSTKDIISSLWSIDLFILA